MGQKDAIVVHLFMLRRIAPPAVRNEPGAAPVRLSLHTDYALRTLMHLGLHQDRLCSIAEIANAHRISENHLMKVVHQLGKLGFVTTLRGRHGGLRLSRDAAHITVGEVVRATEEGLDLLECGSCLLVPACTLTGVLNEAMRSFLAVLDRASIADLLKRPARMKKLLEPAALQAR